MVRTLSVQPPRGAGRIRLVRIGPRTPGGPAALRRHACPPTAEIGRVEVTKLESKGRQNRRIHFILPE
jgi:misacylated tRNA(Ala) deacylase